MKKTLLAVAVFAAASSVNAAEIYKSDAGAVNFYGQLRTEMKFMDATDYHADLTTGSSRIGVDAKYKLTNDLGILGLVEMGVPANSSNDVTVRRHLVGFDTNYGQIVFGRDWTVSDDLGGTDYSYFFGGSGNRYGTLNGAMHDSQIKYLLEQNNWWLKAGYGLNDSTNLKQDLAELYFGSSVGQLDFHLGGGKNRALVASIGNDVSNTYYELTGVYHVTPAFEVSGTYYGAQLKDEVGTIEIDENAFSLGTYWKFANKTALYAGYEYVTQEMGNLDENGKNAFVGVEHKFNEWARVFAEAGHADGRTLGFGSSNSTVGMQEVDGDVNFGVGARVYW